MSSFLKFVTSSNQRILINLRNVTAVQQIGKTVEFEFVNETGGGSMVFFNKRPQKISVSHNTVKEAEETFDWVNKEVEGKCLKPV
jgi:hypothetical protein